MIGSVYPEIIFDGDLFNISSDLDKLEFDGTLDEPVYVWETLFSGTEPRGYLVIDNAPLPQKGEVMQSFFLDYYFRVHTDPLFINLGTIASEITKQVSLWNAWPTKIAPLDSIQLQNAAGISVLGPPLPYSIRRLEEIFYTIVVSTQGDSDIDAGVRFFYTDGFDAYTVHIIGSRIERFDITPEVPINEKWEWLTDVLRSTDGTEQRISLRGEAPRMSQSMSIVFDSEERVRRFATKLLYSKNRLWLPEWQYATRTTRASDMGGTALYYDPTRTDIRVGEYALIRFLNEDSVLVKIEGLTPTGAIVDTPLPMDIEKGSYIVPGSPAIVDESLEHARYATNTVSVANLVGFMNRPRETLTRPNTTSPLTMWRGRPVLDVKPLANSLVGERFHTGQDRIDNTIGEVRLVDVWKYSRVSGNRQFLVRRNRQGGCPDEISRDMDYWRYFLAWCRGAARMFWAPTYRPDITLTIMPGEESTQLLIRESDYFEHVFPNFLSHRFIRLKTAVGEVYREVKSVHMDGIQPRIVLDTALPPGGNDIREISYLLPCRLGGDTVQWEHHGLESFLSFEIRSAEPNEYNE